MRWKRKEKNLREAKASYQAVHPDVDLTTLYDRSRPPAHWADLGVGHADDDLAEYSDEYDIGPYDDDQDDQGAVGWSDAYRVQQAVEAVRAGYEALARPLLARQARNPGVRLPALAALDRKREQETSVILRTYQKAAAMERAAREAPRHVATAHERQQEQAALNAFSMDLQGRSRRYEPPEWTGRSTADLAVW